MTCQPAVWPLWPCEGRAGDRVARTPRMHYDSNGHKDLESLWKSILTDFAGNIYMPSGRCLCCIFESSCHLSGFFSGHWVMQNYLLSMAGCPVIYQTDCGKADWKLTVAVWQICFVFLDRGVSCCLKEVSRNPKDLFGVPSTCIFVIFSKRLLFFWDTSLRVKC